MGSDVNREVGAVRVGRVPFRVASVRRATEQIIDSALGAEPISVRFSNSYCVALASKDEQYAAVLSGSGVNYPDGTPVVWAMKRLRASRNSETVRGPSVFLKVIDRGREYGIGHYLLGTTSSTLDTLRGRLTSQYPGVRIVGSYAPPFVPIDEQFYQSCVRRISSTDSQIVWVALGTPKQDFVAHELSLRTGKVCVAVGAAFDFAAGTVREAPALIHNTGLEWIYRFACEPKRLWKRYTFGNLRFLYSVLRDTGRAQ